MNGYTQFRNLSIPLKVKVTKVLNTHPLLLTPVSLPLFQKNPLGMQGQVAETYGTLLDDMWSGKCSTCSPRQFKVSFPYQPVLFLFRSTLRPRHPFKENVSVHKGLI